MLYVLVHWVNSNNVSIVPENQVPETLIKDLRGSVGKILWKSSTSKGPGKYDAIVLAGPESKNFCLKEQETWLAKDCSASEMGDDKSKKMSCHSQSQTSSNSRSSSQSRDQDYKSGNSSDGSTVQLSDDTSEDEERKSLKLPVAVLKRNKTQALLTQMNKKEQMKLKSEEKEQEPEEIADLKRRVATLEQKMTAMERGQLMEPSKKKIKLDSAPTTPSPITKPNQSNITMATMSVMNSPSIVSEKSREKVKKMKSSASLMQQKEDMLQFIDQSSLDSLVYNDECSLTKTLMSSLFSEEELATSSRTGKSSPKCQDQSVKMMGRKQLNQQKVSAIYQYVHKSFQTVPEDRKKTQMRKKMIGIAFSEKCKDERYRYRKEHGSLPTEEEKSTAEKSGEVSDAEKSGEDSA